MICQMDFITSGEDIAHRSFTKLSSLRTRTIPTMRGALKRGAYLGQGPKATAVSRSMRMTARKFFEEAQDDIFGAIP